MLRDVLAYLQEHPKANSYDVCQAFNISRAMSERLLEVLEDQGEIVLERPATCGTGGSCSTGGGAAARLNALAAKARETKG